MTSTAAELHAHVLRQMRRSGIDDPGQAPSAAQWQIFLERVSHAYEEADSDRYLNDRAWELSSAELQQLNAALAETSASALTLERDRLTTVFNTSDTGLVLLDEEHRITEMNSASATFLGVDREEAVGDLLIPLLWPTGSRASAHRAPAELRIAIASGNPWHGDLIELRLADDESVTCSIVFTPLPPAAGTTTKGGVLAFHDLTQLRRVEQDLAWRATHDPLSGLLNRSAFTSYVDSALTMMVSHLEPCAVLFIDLDRFKTINDTLGHDAGDTALVEAATRIRETVRAEDVVARLGGDEFVVFLERVSGPLGARIVAERLLVALRTPFHVADDRRYLSASIGIALSHGDDVATSLLRDADIALYAAKSAGRDCLAEFGQELRDSMRDRVQIDHDLRRAIERNELAVAYQPIVSLPDGTVVGNEALVRWPGSVGPDIFIPLAEENGTIGRIGDFVLRQAMQRVANDGCPSGSDSRTDCVGMAINVSGDQLAHGGFAASVERLLDEFDLQPAAITIEITENALLSHREPVLNELEQLDSLGVKLALDDFGTGWSSLSLLQQFPISVIKIDRSFVAGMTTSTDDLAIVQAVIQLGAALGHTVVAEGVETQEQADRLWELGCRVAQGYLFGKPEIPVRDEVRSASPHPIRDRGCPSQ
ncbi:MAG: putative bifunctional diguanylate cyclase/phosphodiesterase [Candidatus Nanopelagicales bacterium]